MHSLNVSTVSGDAGITSITDNRKVISCELDYTSSNKCIISKSCEINYLLKYNVEYKLNFSISFLLPLICISLTCCQSILCCLSIL